MTVWWQAIRPKTLLASIGPILLATSLAINDGFFNGVLFLATITCALFLQISVNLANDLFDGRSGVDTDKRLGPVRVLQSGLINETDLANAIKVTIGISIAAGLLLVYEGGITFLILGALCVLGVYTYSAGPYPLASNALGELAVFLFFGLLAVLGCYFLQTNSVTSGAVIYAVIVGLQSSAIMLVNNIRDLETDSAAGKVTLVVRIGEQKARTLFQLLIISSLLIHLFLPGKDILFRLVPVVACATFLPFLYKAVRTYEGVKLNDLLSLTAIFGFVYAFSASISLLL